MVFTLHFSTSASYSLLNKCLYTFSLVRPEYNQRKIIKKRTIDATVIVRIPLFMLISFANFPS